MSQATIPLPTGVLDREQPPRNAQPAFEFGAASPGRPSLAELYGAAFADTITGSIGGYVGNASSREFDPSYRLTPAKLKQLTSDIDPDLVEYFADARSDIDAQNIRRELFEVTQNRRTVASGGIMGGGVYAAAQILDPFTLVATFGSGGLAQAGNATKVGKLLQAGRLGLIEAGVQIPGEALRAQINPNFDAGDVGSNTLSNFASIFGLQVSGATRASRALGGAIGAGTGTFAGQTLLADEDAETAGMQAILAAGFGGLLGAIATPGTLDERLVRDTNNYAKDVDQRLLADAVESAGGLPPGSNKSLPPSRTPRSRRLYDTIFVETEGTWLPDPAQLDDGSSPRLLTGEVADMGDDFVAPPPPDSPGPSTGPGVTGASAGSPVPPAGNPGTGTVGGSAGSPVPPSGNAGAGVPGSPVPPSGPASPFPRPRPAKTYLDADFSDVTDAKASVGFMGFRFGSLYRASRSALPFLRAVANRLDRDILRKTDGSDVLNSAMQWTQRAFTSRFVPFQKVLDQTIENVRKANPNLTPAQIKTAITDAAEGLRPITPDIAPAVDAYRKLAQDGLDTMLRHGVKGAERVPLDPTYVPHAAIRQKIDKAYVADEQGLIEMAMDSLRSGYQKLAAKNGSTVPNDNQLRAYATAWAQNAGRRVKVSALGTVAQSTTELVDEFVRRYQSAFGTLSQADADRIGDIFESMKGDTDAAKFSRLRNALPFDMTQTATLKDGSSWKMTDFFERQIDVLARTYTRKSMGHSSMAAVIESLGDPRLASAQDLLAEANRQVDEFERYANATNLDRFRFQIRRERNNVKRLDHLIRTVLEAPVSEETTVKDLGSIVRAANFARLLASPASAINNAAEPLAAMAQVGFRASLKIGGRALEKTWNGWFSAAKGGTLSDKIIGEIDRLGIAMDFAAGRVLEDSAESGVVKDISRNFSNLQRGVYKWSGQKLVEEGGRKYLTLTLSQTFSDAVDKGISDTRLRSFGLTRKQWDRIAGQIAKHRTTESGPLGSVITGFNFESWDAGFVADARRFNDLLSKKAGELVLQPSAGQMDLWMTSEQGKIVIQLRAYMIASQDRLLRGAQDIKDARMGMTGLVMAGSFSAGLAYAAREYINSLSQDDPQAYRDERLTMSNVATQAFGRASYSTILPFLIDTSLQTFESKPIFAKGRVSQLGQGPGIENALLGNPTFDLINTAIVAGREPIQAATLDDDAFTKYDANAWLRLAPNVFYIRDGLRTLTKDLPDEDDPAW